jgi:4-aminobutyrate aminotransferase
LKGKLKLFRLMHLFIHLKQYFLMQPRFICKKPGHKSLSIIKRDEKITSPSLTREQPFVYDKAKGCYIWDIDGRKYLDFSASVAVMNTGHTNPHVISAIKNQIKKGTHAAFPDIYAETPVNFIEALTKHLPSHLDKCFLSNSGTESVEAGYKIAKWHSNKKWFIAFKNAFHGRTMGSLSMTNSKPAQRERFNPFLPVKHVEYPYLYRSKLDEEDLTEHCLQQFEATVKKLKDVAGVFTEPVQGEGGYIVPTKGFFPGLRKICNEYDILLCDDEVQAGCYRTGTFLAIENYKTKPDIVSMSKALGGGIPLGATVANKKIMNWPEGSHSNTFGGNLVACAAGTASLNFMRNEKLGSRAKKTGNHIMKRLHEIKEKYRVVGDVRGLGLMIGIEIVKDKKSKKYGVKERDSVICKASEKGLIILPAGRSVIRICPPLVITREQADHGIDVLEDSIKEVSI